MMRFLTLRNLEILPDASGLSETITSLFEQLYILKDSALKTKQPSAEQHSSAMTATVSDHIRPG